MDRLAVAGVLAPVALVALAPVALVALASPAAAAPSRCADPVPVYRGGAVDGIVCADAAVAAGLTVVDLSARWAPAALAAEAGGEEAPAYRTTYLALAAERFADAGDDAAIGRDDRYLEVYGVIPTFDVVGARRADDERHRCHAAIDDDAVAAMTGTASEQATATARARRDRTHRLRRTLEREQARRGLADLDALAATGDRLRRRVATLVADEAYLAAIEATQAHLACDRLLATRHVDGAFTWRTGAALAAFQRRHVLSPDGKLGDETRVALTEDSRELDYRTALRALRERVVAATGLVEDGSAGAGHATVLGRHLEPARWGRAPGHSPLPEAAPDLISAATEAAATALGWSDAAATRASLAGALPPKVAVALPALPAYHRDHMELAVEIDRGDVWYDTRPRSRPVERRPALVLYATGGARRIALVRWPTTIGGWNADQLGSGEVVARWKESPPGPVVWRDLYVAPTWLPPDSTPDRELVRRGDGGHVLARESIGPSYRSAYGLVMLVHHTVVERKQTVRHHDHGIRTHGSSRIGSLFDGRSHGCHRLMPLYALRLAGFLLAHRDHVRHGEAETLYRRTVHHQGTHRVVVTTRGHHIELTPPLPVEVLPGTLRTARKMPPTRVVRD
jgi:hypothetical protein